MSNKTIKIGIIFCTCGSTLEEKIDFNFLQKQAENLTYVNYTLIEPLICKQKKEFWKSLKGKFNRLLFIGCSERSSLTFTEDKLSQILDYLEINKAFFETANIREHCVWVHKTESSKDITAKALDMLIMAHAKLIKNIPALETQNLAQEVLIVGGGVAGLSTALTLAELGVKSTIIEKKSHLGGITGQIPFLWQSEGSSSFCTSECVLPVLARDALFSEKVEVLTETEIADVEKKDVNFQINLVKKPEYVDPQLCIACGKCADICPEEGPNPFELGLKPKKAIGKGHFLLFPDTYAIDDSICSKCGKCVEVCPTSAINLDAKTKFIDKTIGSIVLATGFQPAELNKYKHLNPSNPKVITLTQFERLVAHRFFGKPPISVVFVLCQKDDVGYCSKLCCTITLKHAFRMASFFMGTEVTVLYKNLRPMGRNGEHYLKVAQERGVEFIQTEVKEITGDDWLEVKTNDGDFEADLVVLAEPLLPGEVNLMRQLGLQTDEFNYPIEFQPKVVRPGESLVERIFLAGASKGPKDVQDSIDSGAKAAFNAYSALKGKSQKHVSYIDPEKCSHCGLCVPMCPHSAIIREDTYPYFSIASHFCKGCGLCVSTCPSKAITLKNLEDAQILEMVDKAFSHAQPNKPRILAFLCYWCAYGAADLMGPKGFEIPLNVRTIRIRCSASFNIDLAIEILTQNKADGILIGGCPPKNCHHMWGNYLEDRRVKMVKGTLSAFGLKGDSLRFEYIGVTLYDKLAKILNAMSKNLTSKES
ncbi:heterodisulfide reductase subunit A [Desulfonauticus submarinus]|uniref:Heterodisulfide reductase subunit A n=1 Tax=Desulfonauticus submarinus TaxID=206665 RepID=A0A1H0DNB3_9BACT|nr:FAD-dependent oxidoreductase [Desulfonauticus submarinus]SDN71558.1 heterodisulfide reductase subunit A [Desulfonauticus submarinus]